MKKLFFSIAFLCSILLSNAQNTPFTKEVNRPFYLSRQYEFSEDTSLEDINKQVCLSENVSKVCVNGSSCDFSLRPYGKPEIFNRSYLICNLLLFDELGDVYSGIIAVYYKKGSLVKAVEFTPCEGVERSISTEDGVLIISVQDGRVIVTYPNGLGVYLARS